MTSSSSGSGPLDASPAQVLARLTARGHTVGIAESLTGGLLTAALIDVPGASAAVRGGLVCYAPQTKTDVLGVSAELVAARGTVDPQVALAMARRAVVMFGSDWGVSTTGVAGPADVEGLAPGTAYVAVVRAGRGSRVRWLRLPGHRAQIRQAVVAQALDLLALGLSVAPGSRSAQDGRR